MKPVCTVRYYSKVPGIAEAVRHPVVRCGLTRAHVGLRQTAVEGSTWLGSDQDGTPSGKTGITMKLQVDSRFTSTDLFWSF